MKDYQVNREAITEAFCREVYTIVQAVPVGSVTTYGDVACLLGKPQCSRMVGRVLKQVPKELHIPCHRVVNASGRLAPGWDEQRELLTNEGVLFRPNGTVDMKIFRWSYLDKKE